MSTTEPPLYRIEVQGRLGERWAPWFEDMHITVESEITVLTGAVLDQAALLGVLQKLYTLGLPLLLVRREEGERDSCVQDSGFDIRALGRKG